MKIYRIEAYYCDGMPESNYQQHLGLVSEKIKAIEIIKKHMESLKKEHHYSDWSWWVYEEELENPNLITYKYEDGELKIFHEYVLDFKKFESK